MAREAPGYQGRGPPCRVVPSQNGNAAGYARNFSRFLLYGGFRNAFDLLISSYSPIVFHLHERDLTGGLQPYGIERPCRLGKRGEGRGLLYSPTPPGSRLPAGEWAECPAECEERFAQPPVTDFRRTRCCRRESKLFTAPSGQWQYKSHFWHYLGFKISAKSGHCKF